VGTDGSDTAAVAVAQTVGLAERLDAEVVVVTAYGKGEGGDDTPLAVANGLLRDVRRLHPSARIETIAREGKDPAEVIVGAAAETSADLVVVGNRGMTGRRVLGGIPDRVSHHAPCSVLVADTAWAAILPSDEDPHARREVGSLLVATDGSPTAEVAVDTGVGLAEALGAEVVLLFVGEREHGEKVLGRTRERIGERSGVRPVVVAGDPPSRVLEVAAAEAVDLIVVGSKGMRGMRRVFLGGVPNHVTHHADRSVLVVKTS